MRWVVRISFPDIFALGFIAYYKDIHDLIQTQKIDVLPYAYFCNLDIVSHLAKIGYEDYLSL